MHNFFCCFKGDDDHSRNIERQLRREKKQLRRQVLAISTFQLSVLLRFSRRSKVDSAILLFGAYCRMYKWQKQFLF